ncbi:MAG TPA: FmdB family zinc ribbon protein [bacterium]|nr:FmdB family zinc ribbon protein [bacterium]
MPIYEFQCTACKNLFEEFFTKATPRPATKCPECGGKAKKIISNVGIVFKGSGFYVTDSRTQSVSSNGSTKTEAKAEAATESQGTGDASGETGGEGAGAKKKKAKPVED